MIIRVNNPSEYISALYGASCAFGVFDGVHRGHNYIIEQAVSYASEHKCLSAILTFDIDPDELFRPQSIKKLMSNDDRLAALDALGADNVIVLPFNLEFASQTPEQFLNTLFANNIPRVVHVGNDFHFGNKAEGDVADMRAWGSLYEMDVQGYELFALEGEAVTATTIRKHLGECRISQANEMLGHPYEMTGLVEQGRGEGRDMGFRTANISIDAQLFTLGEGVYAAYAQTEAGSIYKAAVSVGGAPSFGERSRRNIEAHLLDFDEDIYGQNLILRFVEFLRPMIVFQSMDELISTVLGNIAWCRENL